MIVSLFKNYAKVNPFSILINFYDYFSYNFTCPQHFTKHLPWQDSDI